jgi:hypothetical protein
LGKTVGGHWIDLQIYQRNIAKNNLSFILYNTSLSEYINQFKNDGSSFFLLIIGLKEMGFDEEKIIEGLKQTDNNEERTLYLLLNQPELLEIKKIDNKLLENTNAYTPTPEEVCNGFVIFLIIFSSL